MPAGTSTLLAAATLAAAITLAGCGQAAAPGTAARKPQPKVTVTVTVTATKTIIRYRPRPHHRSTPTPSAAPAPAVGFGCKVLQTSAGEEFNVTTVGGGSYSGTIYVSFYDYAGSGDVFPGTSVNGATPTGAWRSVPAADIGASAEPAGCTASPG